MQKSINFFSFIHQIDCSSTVTHLFDAIFSQNTDSISVRRSADFRG